MNNVAFLELKYGNIYGGYPNFFVISDVSLIIFEPHSRKIFVESMQVNIDLDIIFVNTKVDELGHTQGRIKFVKNLTTGKKRTYDEDFKLSEEDLENAFKKSRNVKKYVKNFFTRVMRKYRFKTIVTFDGRRDVFLTERCGVDFRHNEFYDLQRELNLKCNYLFSLNKLSVIVNFDVGHSTMRSNNLDYYIHPIAAKQLIPKSASYDAARLLMIYQEFIQHEDNFLMKGALLLNKIQSKQAAATKN